MKGTLSRISNGLLSLLAGLAAFGLTLVGFLWLGRLDQQVAASLLIGLFALTVVRLAAERPRAEHARALNALAERLLAVRAGDLSSPAPPALRSQLPHIAAAVDALFDQVRSNLDNVHAMAMYDPVTELPNRIHFRREAERILKGRQTGRGQAALLFIDLDGFKEVNDRLGHAQGDQTLVMVANRLRVVVKAETDPATGAPPLLARLAGDEFTVLLPQAAGAAEALRVAERALSALAEPFRTGENVTYMGASIGVALSPDHGGDVTALMKAADIAMYQAKADGRSQVRLYDPALAAAASAKLRAEQALRGAIEQDALSLTFQPQICLRSGAVRAIEAVPVWDADPALAETAEQSSLVFELADWSLRGIAAARRRLGRAGVPQRLSIGLSARMLERTDFIARISASLSGAASAEWPVEVELGESAVMRLGDGEAEQLAALGSQGLSIALGGFGSGECSVARLRRMPVRRVALDGALVADVDTSDGARSVAAALVHLLHGLGCEVIAKEVGRPAQLEVLRAIGCDVAQGPACAEAMEEEALLGWFAAREETRRLARAS